MKVTSKEATIDATNMGIFLFIPEQSISDEDGIDLFIHPYFRGSFKLPDGYESASPIYHIQTSKRVKFQKDVIVRIHHYADLQTEEDCMGMAFVSASSTPGESSMYKFEKIAGAKYSFRPEDPFGEIALQHFSFITVVRRIKSIFKTSK